MKTSRRNFMTRLTAAAFTVPVVGAAKAGGAVPHDEIYRRALAGEEVVYKGAKLFWTGWKSAPFDRTWAGQWIAAPQPFTDEWCKWFYQGIGRSTRSEKACRECFDRLMSYENKWGWK